MVESMPVKATSAEDSLRKKLMCQPILQAPWILNVFFLLLSWFLQSLVVLRSSITFSQLTLQSSFKPLSSLVSLFFLLPVWLTAPARVTDCKSLAGDFLEISRRRFWSQPLLWTSCACVRAFLPTRAECQSPSWMWSLMNRWQSVLCFAGLISRRERNKSGIHSVPTFQTNLKKKRTCSLLLVLIQYLFFV